jgi:hypothetical protein
VRLRHATEQDLDAVRACLSLAFAPYEGAYTAAAFRDTVPAVDGLVERLRTMTVLVAEAEDGMVVGPSRTKRAIPAMAICAEWPFFHRPSVQAWPASCFRQRNTRWPDRGAGV